MTSIKSKKYAISNNDAKSNLLTSKICKKNKVI